MDRFHTKVKASKANVSSSSEMVALCINRISEFITILQCMQQRFHFYSRRWQSSAKSTHDYDDDDDGGGCEEQEM